MGRSRLFAVLASVAPLGSIISVELGITVALVELTRGAVGGLNVSLSAVVSILGLLVFPTRSEDDSEDRVRPPARATSRPPTRRLHDAPHEHRTDVWHDCIALRFERRIIDKTQFSLLVTVVVLSAVVPTALAGRWFLPDAERERRIPHRRAGAEAEEFV